VPLSPSRRSVAPTTAATLDYIQVISEEMAELHGDRPVADDQALVGGIGRIGDQTRLCCSATRKTGHQGECGP